MRCVPILRWMSEWFRRSSRATAPTPAISVQPMRRFGVRSRDIGGIEVVMVRVSITGAVRRGGEALKDGIVSSGKRVGRNSIEIDKKLLLGLVALHPNRRVDNQPVRWPVWA